MPASTLQPRVIDEIDENAIDMLDDGLFLEGTNENISNWTRGHSRPAATQLLESGNLRSP
jgi:hypothetical protein